MGIKKPSFNMDNFEITKREILGSIVIGAVLLIIGFMIHGGIVDRNMDKNEKYNKAVKIETSELFEYGMKTNVGNAFVYGDLETVDPVTYPEIDGEYMYVKKTKEKYTMHTRVVRYKVGKHWHSRTETYWTWDYAGHEDKTSKKVTFLGNEFDIGKFDMPSSSEICKIKESSRIRYVYSGVPAKHTGTIFTELKDGTIPDNNYLHEDKTIEATNESLQVNYEMGFFWCLWIVFSGLVIFGWFYLKNDWLE